MFYSVSGNSNSMVFVPGRNYVVEDGDVIFFKFNAGAGLKDAKKK
jgi:ribosome-binding ATPase YchF (GTP1/OBG family)